jgi:hypothetical protein
MPTNEREAAMSEWLVRKGDPASDPVSLARNREVLEWELDGRPFVFSCEVVPNDRSGTGVAVMMHLAELEGPPCASAGDASLVRGEPIHVDDLAAAFEGDELPPELDLATIVTCRSRTEWLFASAAEMVRGSTF